MRLCLSPTTACLSPLTTYSPPQPTHPGEFRGFVGRARWLIANAQEALADTVIAEESVNGATLKRRIKRVPVGVVLIIAPWK